MAHIHHFRNINHVRNLSVAEAIPPGSVNTSFGAFGGTKYQRDLIGFYEISRVLGYKGIILIHNDFEFESNLGQVYTIEPALQQGHNTPTMYLANRTGNVNSFYDPLYGLSAANVLDAIAPLPSDSRMFSEIQLVRSILADYLEIMNYQFRIQSAAFGQYPYNLDLLYELTSMPFSSLMQTVLRFLPGDYCRNLSQRLSAPDAQQRAFHAVRSFALTLSTCLWTRKGFRNHSRLSLISAASSRNLISIYVPGSRKEILDYLAIELKALNDRRIPFLLVTSGINTNESSEFKKLFLNDHITLPYSTGILSEDVSSIISTGGAGMAQNLSGNSDLSALFSQTQEIFVFSCSSTLAAAPFSESTGSYYRNVTEKHREVHRAPFHIFPSHGHGQTRRETRQAIINPEELTNLGDGCFICGSNHPTPILVNHFVN